MGFDTIEINLVVLNVNKKDCKKVNFRGSNQNKS